MYRQDRQIRPTESTVSTQPVHGRYYCSVHDDKEVEVGCHFPRCTCLAKLQTRTRSPPGQSSLGNIRRPAWSLVSVFVLSTKSHLEKPPQSPKQRQRSPHAAGALHDTRGRILLFFQNVAVDGSLSHQNLGMAVKLCYTPRLDEASRYAALLQVTTGIGCGGRMPLTAALLWLASPLSRPFAHDSMKEQDPVIAARPTNTGR